MKGLNRVLNEGEPARTKALLSHRVVQDKGYQSSGRYGHGVAAVNVAGKTALVLFGGIDKNGKYPEEVDAFDTSTKHWKLLTTSEQTHIVHLSAPEPGHKKSRSKGNSRGNIQSANSHYPPQTAPGNSDPPTHANPAPRHEVSNTQNLNIKAELSFGKKEGGTTPHHTQSASVKYVAPKKVGTEGNEALGRTCHSMVVYESNLYVFGGKNKFFLNDLWKFDFDELKWIRLEFCANEEDRPCRRMGHTAVVHGGMMWVFGGFSADGESLNDLWSYNFSNSAWQKKGYHGDVEARYEHSADVVGDAMYVFGGKGNFTAANNQCLKYDFQTNTWTSLCCEEGPSPRWGHASGANAKALYIYGGFGEYRGYLSDCYALDFASMKWHKTEIQGDGGSPDAARELHTLNFVGSRAYLFGGIGPDGVLDDMIELWDFTE